MPKRTRYTYSTVIKLGNVKITDNIWAVALKESPKWTNPAQMAKQRSHHFFVDREYLSHLLTSIN